MRTIGALLTTLPLVAAAAVPSLPDAVPAGHGRLTFIGMPVYDARLWVAPPFRRSALDTSSFALELTYLRGFRAADIARRSVAEMERSGPLDPQQARRWESELLRLLPDVRKGDRLLGVHRPGNGALFFHNGRVVGSIADLELARRFFAIWLAPSTSEPALREALLAGTSP